MEPKAASRGDAHLAHMIQLYQNDPVRNASLCPNTHVFNTIVRTRVGHYL